MRALISLRGDLVSLRGDLVSLRGDLVSLCGDLVSLRGDLVSFDFCYERRAIRAYGTPFVTKVEAYLFIIYIQFGVLFRIDSI